MSSSDVFSGLETGPPALGKKLNLASRSNISSRTGLLLFWVSAALGCEQRYWGQCLWWLSQGREKGAQTPLPCVAAGAGGRALGLGLEEAEQLQWPWCSFSGELASGCLAAPGPSNNHPWDVLTKLDSRPPCPFSHAS